MKRNTKSLDCQNAKVEIPLRDAGNKIKQVKEIKQINKQINELNDSDFWSQYKHPLWQKKRLEIMKRDDFKCTICEDKEKELNVHHAYYDKNLKIWEYDNEYYSTLCKGCHEDIHLVKNELKLYIDKNFSSPTELLRMYEFSIAFNNLPDSDMKQIIKIVKTFDGNKIPF